MSENESPDGAGTAKTPLKGPANPAARLPHPAPRKRAFDLRYREGRRLALLLAPHGGQAAPYALRVAAEELVLVERELETAPLEAERRRRLADRDAGRRRVGRLMARRTELARRLEPPQQPAPPAPPTAVEQFAAYHAAQKEKK